MYDSMNTAAVLEVGGGGGTSPDATLVTTMIKKR